MRLHISKINVVGPLNFDHARVQNVTEEVRESAGSCTYSSSGEAEGTRRKLNSSGGLSTSTHSDTEAEGKDDRSSSPAAHTTELSGSSWNDDMVSISAERKSGDSHIRVEASFLPLHQCDRFCLCHCHKVTNLVTPNSLGRLIGRLFIGYVGLPLLSHRTCNRITCRRGRSQTTIRIAYLFPLWFALRLIALTITKASTTFMWTLSFPAVTQTGCSMLVLTSMGSIEKVQGLLATNAAILNAVDIMASKSPLHVGGAIGTCDGDANLYFK